jgi:hypothetical protein
VRSPASPRPPRALTTYLALIASKGSSEVKPDQSRTTSPLKQPSLCLSSPPKLGIFGAFLDGMRAQTSDGGAVGSVG